MTLEKILSSQVSTRFLLTLFSLVGIFVYAFWGPMAYAGDAVVELLGAVKFIVAVYVGGKAVEHGIERFKR